MIAFLYLSLQCAVGQTDFSTKTFHKHEQVCHFVGTTEYDYLIQLQKDSTVSFIVYSSDFNSQYKTVNKEIYEGRYRFHNDTVRATFTIYNSFTKKKGDKSKLLSSEKNQPVNVNRLMQFFLTEENIVPLNSYIPKMNKSSPVRYDWLSTKFDLWQNKELSDQEIFGLVN